MKTQHQPLGITLKDLFVRAAALVLFTLALCAPTRATEPIEVFRTGPELIIRFDRFDLLREANTGLMAELKLHGQGRAKDLLIDLSDAAVNGTLVIDLSKFGNCSEISITVKNAAGKRVAATTVSPIVEVPVKSRFPVSVNGPFAFIEPGTAMSAAAAGVSVPKIQLPDVKTLRTVRIERPKRSIAKQEITFPVITESEAPLRGGFVVSRQTAAPKDPTKASLYISYKKAIYEGAKLIRWQKFLVELPIQESWGQGHGDETVNIGNDVQVHVTSEVKEKDWRGVGNNGLLSIEPYLEIECASSHDWQDLDNCVRCFMPDLTNKDGSIDLIVGWDSKDRDQAKPFVRVIKDFIPPTAGR